MRTIESRIPVRKMAEHRFEERIVSPKARWYFTKQELQDSPSRVHGVDPDKELSYRQQAANMIQDMGQRLNVNQLCINTAIVYMHRFYTVHSFRTFHRANVATAAIFLAAKVEEQPRKLEHVAKVSYACQNRDAPTLDTQNEVYTRLIEDITYHELLLLETLGFEVAVDHPHQHVVKCTHLLRASKDLSQTAYFMAHNSLLLTTFCLEHRPTVVACVCIHLACRWKGLQIPRSSDNKDWWEYVDKDITLEQLNSLTKEFLLIYEKCPSRLQKKITEPMKSKSSSADQPSTSSASRYTSTDKGKLNAHSLPHKHKPTNPAAQSHASHSQPPPQVPSQPQSVHKPPSLPHHHQQQQQQHSKHANTSHHNTSTAGPKSHEVKHHVEQPSASKHLPTHSFLPVHTHSTDHSLSNSTLPPGVAGKVPHKHHKSHLQGSSSKLSEFGGKHPISGGGSAGKVMAADQKQRAAKHRLSNPNHDSIKTKEHQKVMLKRPHSGENPERKKPRLDHPPLPPLPSISGISGMPPLPPLPSEPELPPPPPSLPSSQVSQMPFKGLPFQAPQTGHFPPLPSVPDLPPLPPPLPLSPDDSFLPPPPPPPANSR